VFTIVIIDPYRGLRKGEIDSYDFEDEYLEDVIHVHKPDFKYGMREEDEDYEEELEEESD
jgi:hypothetical protein